LIALRLVGFGCGGVKIFVRIVDGKELSFVVTE
jgi:hypothetical protein